MQISLNNVMEEVITRRVEEIIDTLICCKCERCKLDIIAYALNHVPPKYVVTSEGALISLLSLADMQTEADITRLIVKASELISESPHHI